MEQQFQTLTTNFEGHAIDDHFADVGKMVELGKGDYNEQLAVGNEQ